MTAAAATDGAHRQAPPLRWEAAMSVILICDNQRQSGTLNQEEPLTMKVIDVNRNFR